MTKGNKKSDKFEANLDYKRKRISAGSYYLNKWLYGGYEKDIITTLYGPAGSGKTNFCILAAVSQAKKGNKVIFIDTEGGFSTERVKQILDFENVNNEKVLKNIILLKVTTFEEQKKVFSNLNKKIRNKGKIGLIVVDGMTMLYRLELGEASQGKGKSNGEVKKINRELVKQMRTLAEIARKKEIPILATNQVYSDFLSEEDISEGKKKKMRMVGGDIMKYWSKCIIELQKNGNKKKAILRKHRSLPEKEMEFIITKKGIKKKSSFFG